MRSIVAFVLILHVKPGGTWSQDGQMKREHGKEVPYDTQGVGHQEEGRKECHSLSLNHSGSPLHTRCAQTIYAFPRKRPGAKCEDIQ